MDPARLEASSSSVIFKTSVTGLRRQSLPLPSTQQQVQGFASIVTLKDGDGTGTVRGSRRIQISQLGIKGGSEVQTMMPAHEGGIGKKRWSFHSASHVTEFYQKDMKEISSPKKRRKSDGPGRKEGTVTVNPDSLVHSVRDAAIFAAPSSSHHQSRSSRQHVLTNRQSQNERHHHRRISSGRIISIDKESGMRSGKQKLLDVYSCPYDSFDMSDDHTFRLRKPKPIRDVPKPVDYLSTMPDEILLRIFKYLPKQALGNLAQASQRYLKITQDETLWKRLCVMSKMLLPEHLLVIMSRNPMYLRMAKAWIPDPEDLPSNPEALAATSQLLYLDLSAATVSARTIALILKISPKLVKLSLEHLPVTEEVVEQMMNFAGTIEVLNLALCNEVNAQPLVGFLRNCVRLKELNMGCMKCEWSQEDLKLVVSALPPTVQQLNISGYRNTLDNSHIEIIVNRCPQLVELDVSDSQDLQGKTLEYMLKLPHLQHLGLSRCYGIEPAAYTILAHHKSLKYMDLFSLFKESSLRQLCSNLPGVEVNHFPFSAVARPTVGQKRSSIWLQRVRD